MADRDTTVNHGGAESPDPATFGNRPATGARVVEHAAHLPSSFGGGQEATDFLGLSQEIVGADGGAPPPAHEVAPASTSYGAEPESSASWLLSGREQAQQAETSESEELETEEAEPVRETGGSKRLLSVTVAILLIGAAVTVAMRFSRKDEPPPTTIVATNPTTTPTRDPSELASNPDRPGTGRHTILPDGTTVPVETSEPPVSSTGPDTTTEPTTTASTAEPTSSRIGAKRLSEWKASHGWTRSDPGVDGAGSLAGTPSTPAGWPTADAFAFASNARNGMPSAGSVSTDVEPTTPSDPVPLVLTTGAQDPQNPLSPF
jgi:hypothetical protein